MWPAYGRAAQVFAPKHLVDLRRDCAGGAVALRCFLPQCRACKRFYNSPAKRKSFEAQELPQGTQIIPWDCAQSDQHRQLAAAAGVDNLPAYVLISVNGTISVIEPAV